MESAVLQTQKDIEQINKEIDDALLTSTDSDILELKGYLEAKDIDKAHEKRKAIYLSKMNLIQWRSSIHEFYRYMPYHDEITLFLDGRSSVIPKKTGLEGGKN